MPIMTHLCEKCSRTASDLIHVEDYDEYWCGSCLDNAAESAWERHNEDFHDGGSTQFKSLLEQQAEARKLK